MKNKKLEKVNRIRHYLLGLEMSLSLLDDDLQALDKNLNYLYKMQQDLSYNIDLHKSNKVITVIGEYKKSINQLKVVQDEIFKNEVFKKEVQAKINKKSKAYAFYLDEYAQAYEDLNNEPVILLFRKGNLNE